MMTTPNSGPPGDDVSGRFAPCVIIPRLTLLHHSLGRDRFPFHIGADGRTDDRLPWRVQAHHAERYCDRYAEITVDEIAQRPVVRLSMDDELAIGRSLITVEDGLETLAVFRDFGIEQIDIEVPWEQAIQIEARLT